MRKPYYTIGVEQLIIEGNIVNVYDSEKTVCDFIKFKNKLGFDTAKEVFKTYLGREDRNIHKLVQYSKMLRIHSTIDQYLKISI